MVPTISTLNTAGCERETTAFSLSGVSVFFEHPPSQPPATPAQHNRIARLLASLAAERRKRKRGQNRCHGRKKQCCGFFIACHPFTRPLGECPHPTEEPRAREFRDYKP